MAACLLQLIIWKMHLVPTKNRRKSLKNTDERKNKRQSGPSSDIPSVSRVSSCVARHPLPVITSPQSVQHLINTFIFSTPRSGNITKYPLTCPPSILTMIIPVWSSGFVCFQLFTAECFIIDDYCFQVVSTKTKKDENVNKKVKSDEHYLPGEGDRAVTENIAKNTHVKPNNIHHFNHSEIISTKEDSGGDHPHHEKLGF